MEPQTRNLLSYVKRLEGSSTAKMHYLNILNTLYFVGIGVVRVRVVQSVVRPLFPVVHVDGFVESGDSSQFFTGLG